MNNIEKGFENSFDAKKWRVDKLFLLKKIHCDQEGEM